MIESWAPGFQYPLQIEHDGSPAECLAAAKVIHILTETTLFHRQSGRPALRLERPGNLPQMDISVLQHRPVIGELDRRIPLQYASRPFVAPAKINLPIRPGLKRLHLGEVLRQDLRVVQ